MDATKPNGKSAKPKPTIGPADALGMLESAINYCRAAGLTVKGGNVGGALTLAIVGAVLADSGRFVVKLAQPEPAGEVAHE
jgi:hypothetical protein